MDNKLLCFNIDGNDLYLDKSLIRFNEIPIFFLCRDNNDVIYAVQCIDTEELNYYVVQVDKKNILGLLDNTLTIHDFMTSSKKKWEVQSGENISDDIVKPISQLNEEDLVEKNVYLSLDNTEISNYKDKIQEERLYEMTISSNDSTNGKFSNTDTSNKYTNFGNNYIEQLIKFFNSEKLISVSNKAATFTKIYCRDFSDIPTLHTNTIGYITNTEDPLDRTRAKLENFSVLECEITEPEQNFVYYN